MGLTLVVLGCQKFLIPELPMGVIQNYADQIFEPMNRLTGVTEEQYVFAAATVEFSVGLLLILGLFTRLLMLVLAGMFTTTLFIFKGELIGHLPLFGIVVALFIAGGGRFRVGMPQLGRGLPASAMLLLVIMLPGLGACGNSTVQGATLPDTAPLSQDGKLLTVRLQSGAYTFDLRFERPVISQLFSIETTVTKTATGELLNSGLLRVNASMPEHGHGMQTEPRTKRISQGIYSTAGMKMHMNGSWELSAKIEIDGDYEHAIGRFDFGPPIRPIAPITK